jgi:transcriptional regulator with XRE-family HTH domain
MAPKAELGDFLKSRRDRLRPEDVGLPSGGQRRVPGLRREELAMLAGVSVDYYVRLEQGRDLTPSEAVLDALARALRLDDTERAHLIALARPPQIPFATPDAGATTAVRPSVQMLIDGLDQPAFVMGRRMDILATNRMARALLTDFDARPARERNHARWIFLDPATRGLYVDWPVIARDNVAILRHDMAQHPDDPQLRELIRELSMASPEFRTWWVEHDVTTRNSGIKRYRHPVVGEMTIHFEAMRLADEDQLLFVYSVEPRTASHDAMRLLATWAATQDAVAAREPTRDMDDRTSPTA